MSAAEFRTSKTTLEVVGDKVYATLAISSRKSAGPKRHDVTRLLSTDPARLASYDGVEATVGWTSDGHIIRVTPLDGFLNPYAFISIPDRAELPAVLGDGEPVGHDRYRPDRWTGTIPVIMTTRTPLLLPDHARAAAEDEAGALPVRVDHERRPILAGSAIKGLLRSSYEAITNSRFGVFAGHDRPLATRGNANQGVTEDLRPAWVTAVGDNWAELTVVQAITPLEAREKFDFPVQTAVWVPHWLACKRERPCPEPEGCGRSGGGRCAWRGREVEAWIYLAKIGKAPLWRVYDYSGTGSLGPAPTAQAIKGRMRTDGGKKLTYVDHPPVRVRGLLHWTGATFPAGGHRKHDDRLVVTEVIDGPAELEADKATLSPDLLDRWRAVIDSYAQAHERDKYRTTHYGGYVTDPERWKALRRNDTLYVELAKGGTVTSLYPAMIGRKPFPGAPVLSLPEEHHPATELGQLSPADRVFGWVPDGGDERGHRGHLRVIPPDGDDRPGPGCVRTFARPVPLTVLNSPKPSQFLFYLGNADGSPRHGAAKEPTEGYPATPGERRLRGRKVYLTHAEVLDDQPGAAEYWTPPEGVPGKPTPLTVGGRQRYREYVRYQKPATDGKAEEPNDEVTTWISGWVEPGTTFRFTLHVDNLSDTELGALLWLLILPEKATLKLGLGKPLGFGAVGLEVDWDGVRLFTGDRLLDRYRTLRREPAPAALDEVKALRDAYDRLLHEYLPQVRTEFLNAAQGLAGVPVHYPRADNESGTVRLAGQPSEPRTTSYDWWVENDRVRKEGAYRHALGELADFESLLLPYHPPKQKSDKKQGRDGRDEHAEDGRANSGGLGAQGQRWPGSNRRRDSRSDSTGPHNQRRRGGGSRRH